MRAKFFDPASCWTWYATEGGIEDEDGDGFTFFGLVFGFDREYGYFTLAELQVYRGAFGLPVERDLYFTPCKVSELPQ